MSFDLYFCWRKHERTNFDEVKEWAGVECFTPHAAQLYYSNPKTGVYFSFDFEPQAPESPEDGPYLPEGYFDSGLSFNLNYLRPSYFGFEAMPIVEKLASRFGLHLVNPQERYDGPAPATAADGEVLIRSWIDSNRSAILSTIKQPNSKRPLSMSPAASTYLWRYQKAKEDLERACGEAVFVPSLVPVQRKGEKIAGRAITYTQGLPMIVPECEWVFLVRPKKGLFRSKKDPDVDAISGETFREVLASYVKPFHSQQPAVQIINPDLAEKAGKAIRAIDRTLPRSEFEVVGMDSFVDIDLPSASG
jgi:hypothetical protein